MRKVMMLAAMLAMVLVAAAPALAQATAEGGDVQVQYQDCNQIIAALAQQTNYGDAGAVSGDVGSAAAADVAQELGVSVEAVQNCIQAGGDIAITHGGGGAAGGAAAGGAAAAGAAAGGAAAGGAAAGGVAAGGAAPATVAGLTALPDTGGVSLFTLGAGALLVAGGLLARRVIR